MKRHVWMACLVAGISFTATACGGDNNSTETQTTCPEGQQENPFTGVCVPPNSGTQDMENMGDPDDMGTAEETDQDGDTSDPPDMNDAMDMPAQEDMADMSPAEEMGTDPDMDPDMGPTGTLSGSVTRSTEPSNGGVGGVYVAVFARNPVTNQDDPGTVAFQRIPDVDFNPPSTSVQYMMTGIPPRPEPYYVVAFLDDNMTVDPANPDTAFPDEGDLLTLENFAAPQVTIDSASDFTLDLDLNIAVPPFF